MAMRTVYVADPQLQGQLAYDSGAAVARRQNLERSAERGQRSALAGLQADLNREGRAQQAWLQQQENARLAQNDYLDYLSNQQNNESRLREQQQSELQETVRQGLKDGTFYYSADQENKANQVMRSISLIQADSAIDDDLRDQMVSEQLQEYQRIRSNPMIRMKPKEPTPEEKFAQQSLLVSSSNPGQVYAFGDPNAPPDAVPLTMNRSGVFQAVKDPLLAFKQKQVDNEQKQADARRDAVLRVFADLSKRTKTNSDYQEVPYYENDEQAMDAAVRAYELMESRLNGTQTPMRSAPAQSQAGPVRVRTPQEAMSLPSGTTFITPDGRVKVRP